MGALMEWGCSAERFGVWGGIEVMSRMYKC